MLNHFFTRQIPSVCNIRWMISAAFQVLILSVLELFFCNKDCPQEKKDFVAILAEIMYYAIWKDLATLREQYISQTVLGNIKI